MLFKTTPYHYNLLRDIERLSVFYEAIEEFASKNPKSNAMFDIGCGSGILSFFAHNYFNKILAIEINPKIADYAKENLNQFKNIKVINEDALDFNYDFMADLIVCEMLDTALIDEEQIPALLNAKKYLKENGKIIPEAVVNTAELVNMARGNIHYDDVDSNTQYHSISNVNHYQTINFLEDFNQSVDEVLEFKIKEAGNLNGIKITTFTVLSQNLIAGPTPMLNPPLLIPIDEKTVENNDFIEVRIRYEMGNGIETIKVNYI